MVKPVLQIEQLCVYFKQTNFCLHPISLTLNKGDIVSVVGESGSGKTTLLKAISHLSDKKAHITGRVWLNGADLYSLSPELLRQKRFTEFSLVFQNSKEYLNPVTKIREQLYEILKRKYPKEQLASRAEELINLVGLDVCTLDKYPAALSGGMVQKFLLASAIALKPRLIVLDEPTSSLDPVSREEFVCLIKEINREHQTAFLLVTHDLSLANALSSRILVLYQGILAEYGNTSEVLAQPLHPYTRGLVGSSMDLNAYRDIWGIRPGEKITSNGCPFFNRCTQHFLSCSQSHPSLTVASENSSRLVSCHRGGVVRILEAISISKNFGKHQVLNNCNFHLYSGEFVSLVGRSGSGKTTFSQIIAGLLNSDGGTVLYNGVQIEQAQKHRMRNGLQMVLQDNEDALNPRLTVYEAIAEPLILIDGQNDYSLEILSLLQDVGLPADRDFLNLPIRLLSGGQKQRVAVARALSVSPSILVADEPTSMLDESSKANLIRMLKGLQNKRGFSMLMVTHDITCAVKASDRIYIMENMQTNMINHAELTAMPKSS